MDLSLSMVPLLATSNLPPKVYMVSSPKEVALTMLPEFTLPISSVTKQMLLPSKIEQSSVI